MLKGRGRVLRLLACCTAVCVVAITATAVGHSAVPGKGGRASSERSATPAASLVGLQVQMVGSYTAGTTQPGVVIAWPVSADHVSSNVTQNGWQVHKPGTPDPPGPALTITIFLATWPAGGSGPPSPPCATHNYLNVQSPSGDLYAMEVWGGKVGCPGPVSLTDSPLGPAFPIEWDIWAEGTSTSSGGGCGFATISGPPFSESSTTPVTMTLLLTDARSDYQRKYFTCEDGKAVGAVPPVGTITVRSVTSNRDGTVSLKVAVSHSGDLSAVGPRVASTTVIARKAGVVTLTLHTKSELPAHSSRRGTVTLTLAYPHLTPVAKQVPVTFRRP